MSEIKENIIVTILKYPPVKYLIIILLGLLVYSGFNHFYRCYKELNSSFLWGAHMCTECHTTIVKIDSITKHDTVNVERVTKVPQIVKQNSPIVSQSNKVGKNEVNQNYGENKGLIGGSNNTQNNLGIIPRRVNETDVIPYIKDIENKSIEVNFVVFGVADSEIAAVRDQIIEIMQKHGFKNFERRFMQNFAVDAPPRIEVSITDQMIQWHIPPAKM